jgi:hypothetical protein
MSTHYITMRTYIQLETLDEYTITRKEIYDHIVPLLGNNLTQHTCGFEPRDITEWKSFLMGGTCMYADMNADDYGNPTAYALLARTILEQYPKIVKVQYELDVDEQENNFVVATWVDGEIKTYLLTPVKTITYEQTEI